MLSRLIIAALWTPGGKGLTSWLSFVMFNCVFVTFPCDILYQVWYLIVSIPSLCHLSYLHELSSQDSILQNTRTESGISLEVSVISWKVFFSMHDFLNACYKPDVLSLIKGHISCLSEGDSITSVFEVQPTC